MLRPLSQVSFSTPISERDISNLLQIFPQGIIFLDLETTGLSPMIDKIIEIGAIKIKPDRSIEVFEQLVHPQITITEQSTLIHKITNQMVEESPSLDKVLPAFIDFLGDYPLIAQNAKFDIGFIVFALYQLNFYFPPSKIYDSCRFARKALPENKSYGLSALAAHFKVSADNHHRALEDSLICLKVVSECFQILEKEKNNIHQVKSYGYLFRMDDFKKLSSFDYPPHLQDSLPQALKKDVVEIEYKGGSVPNQLRPIKPVGLIPLPQGIVLYALCFLSQSYKSFFLKKIKSIKIISKDYQESILRQHAEDRAQKE